MITRSFPHIRAKKPDLDRKLIQYPIEDRKDQWENKNKWFKRAVLEVVGKWQPYRQADPNGHSLRTLRELVNMDKHRDLVIASDYCPLCKPRPQTRVEFSAALIGFG